MPDRALPSCGIRGGGYYDLVSGFFSPRKFPSSRPRSRKDSTMAFASPRTSTEPPFLTTLFPGPPRDDSLRAR